MNISNTVEDVLDPLIGMRILVVEDNELNLEIVTERFEGARAGLSPQPRMDRLRSSCFKTACRGHLT